MANILRAESADNRGTEDVPYGFVYFTDGMRVAYTGNRNADGMTYEITDTSGGWGPVTEIHRRMAREYLEGDDRARSGHE